MKPWSFFIISLITLSALSLIDNYSQNSNEVIEITFDSKNSKKAYLYINSDWNNPVIIDTKPGKQIYKAEGSQGKIKSLRLDPTNSSNDSIKLYKIEIKHSDKTTLSILPEQLKNWSSFNISNKIVNDQYVEYMGDNKTPMNLHGSLGEYSFKSNFLGTISKKIVNLNLIDYLLLISYLIFINILFNPQKNKIIVLFLFVLFYNYYLYEVLHHYFSGFANISSAIGKSTYLYGISALGNQLSVLLCFVGAGLIGYILGNKNESK